MTKVFESWGAGASGDSPRGFVTVNAANGTATINSGKLRLHCNSGGAGNGISVCWEKVRVPGGCNGELSGQFTIVSTNFHINLYITLAADRNNVASAPAQAYGAALCVVDFAGTPNTGIRLADGSGTWLYGPDATEPTADTAYLFKFRRVGALWTAKCWAATTAESAATIMSGTNATYADAIYAYPALGYSTGNTTAKDIDFDWLCFDDLTGEME